MFSNNKKSVEPEKPVKKFNTETAVTILTKGCSFNGKLYCKGSTRIAGEVEGVIVSEGLLVIEESANIKGDVQGDEVVIHGKVQGSVRSKGRVALAPTCRLKGDIYSPALVIAEGANFIGSCDMHNQATSTNNSSSTVHGKKVETPTQVHIPPKQTSGSDVKIAARNAQQPAKTSA